MDGSKSLLEDNNHIDFKPQLKIFLSGFLTAIQHRKGHIERNPMVFNRVTIQNLNQLDFGRF